MASKLRMPTCRHATNVQLTRMEAMCIGDKGCMCYMCVCARDGKVHVYADMDCQQGRMECYEPKEESKNV